MQLRRSNSRSTAQFTAVPNSSSASAGVPRRDAELPVQGVLLPVLVRRRDLLTSPSRVAVIDPSAVAVYPDAEVPRFSGAPDVPEVFAGAYELLYGITSATAYAVTVANTVPVSISSTIPGVAAADPSKRGPTP